MNPANEEYRDTKARKWSCAVPTLVTVETETPIDLDTATELAVSGFSQNQEVIIPRPGPEHWAKLWTEADQDEVVVEDAQETNT